MEKKVKKKLLFVGSYPPPYGGIASHLFDLLPHLVIDGYEVISVTPALEDRVQQSPGMRNIFIRAKHYFLNNIVHVLFASLRCIRIKKDVQWEKFLRSVNLACIISNILEKEKIYAIFVYSNDYGYVIPILKKLGHNIPSALMIFGAFYLKPDEYRRNSNYLSDVFNSCNMILASSRFCAESIERVLGFTFPVRVVYIGVDEEIYELTRDGNMLRSELGIPSDAIVFLFMGRMIKHMGLDFLLDIARRLLNIHPNVYLIIGGARGDLSSQAEKLAAEEPRVRYCPDIPFAKKLDFYAMCDVLLAPTMEKQACMGVSIKEVMACGKPVIASGSGGIPEAVEDGTEGYIIPIVNGRLDENIFLDRAAKLAGNSALCKEMGMKGREKVMRLFSNKQTIRQYREIIGEFLR